jgi:hypothetical protein
LHGDRSHLRILALGNLREEANQATPEFTIIGIVPIDWNNRWRQSIETNTARVSWLASQTEGAVARLHSASVDEGRMIDVTGVKVFSATKAKERELLGELITDWIRSHPDHEIVDKIVTQSSDSEFHCLTITLFYKHNKA